MCMLSVLLGSWAVNLQNGRWKTQTHSIGEKFLGKPNYLRVCVIRDVDAFFLLLSLAILPPAPLHQVGQQIISVMIMVSVYDHEVN